MMDFLIYEGKVAVALLVFYLFYRFLLKKETFHRFNRVVLVGTAVLSFLLPLCIITIKKPLEMTPPVLESTVVLPITPAEGIVPIVEEAAPWWPMALTILFWAGVAFVLLRIVISILSIDLIIRLGEQVREEDGCRIIVTDREIAPFSWMRCIVLSRKDWESDHAAILTHEKAHIALGHSYDILLVDVLSALQWFNPAIWMLRADLQELHEYEADDAVLRAGTDLKEYQYLLIRKAVDKSGYSVANSFNHSILKKRFTMMSKSRSPLSRGWRALYLLPLVCLGLGLQARTVYVPEDKDNNNSITVEGGQGDVKKIVTMNVDARGRIVIDDQEVPLDGIADYLRSLGLPGAEIGVSIEQVEDTPAEVMTALQDQLRQAGVLKAQYRAFASTPLYMLRQPSGEERMISQEEFRSLDQRRMVSTDVLMGPDATEKYGEKAKNGAIIVTYKEGDINMDPFPHTYYLTPFEFSTLVITDIDGGRITNFRSQPTMTSGQDEFVGLYVSENPKTGPAEYVVRPVGGKPIKTIQWQSPPASTHVLYINGRRGISLQARSGQNQNPLIILRQAWGEEHEITKEEYDNLDSGRIQGIGLMKDDAAWEKYGEKAAHGVIVITLKAPMEMDEIVVVSYRDKDDEEAVPFYLVPNKMPRFQGGDLNGFSEWLCQRITVPNDCNHSGTMKVSFAVLADGTVGDVEVTESVCPELDALVKATILKSPKWEPGTTKDGKPIATNLRIPITFQMRHVTKKK